MAFIDQDIDMIEEEYIEDGMIPKDGDIHTIYVCYMGERFYVYHGQDQEWVYMYTVNHLGMKIDELARTTIWDDECCYDDSHDF